MLRPIVSVDPAPRAVLDLLPGALGPRSVTTRSAHALQTQAPAAVARSRTRMVAGIASAAVVVVALVLVGVVVTGTLDGSGRPAVEPATSGLARPTIAGIATVVPAPTALVGVRHVDGSVEFTWVNPEPAEGDQYLWGERTATGRPTLALVGSPRVTVPSGDGKQVCIEVSIVRADRSASARPTEVCAG